MDLRKTIKNVTDDYAVIEVCGGNNGNPDWSNYFIELRNELEELKKIFKTDRIILEKINNDTYDDIFYATFLIYK